MSDFGQAVARANRILPHRSRILANGEPRKGWGRGSQPTVSRMDRNQEYCRSSASSVAEAMNFRWLPITSLQSLFAEFVPALLQCLAPEREAGWHTDGAASELFFDRQLRVTTDVP